MPQTDCKSNKMQPELCNNDTHMYVHKCPYTNGSLFQKNNIPSKKGPFSTYFVAPSSSASIVINENGGQFI